MQTVGQDLSMPAPKSSRPMACSSTPHRYGPRAPKPLDGYFEWKAIRGEKTKQPYAIAMKPFALAAIWDSWRDAKGCSIGRSRPHLPAE